MRAAGVLSVLQSGVELFGRHGDTQGGEIGKDLFTQDRRARHGRSAWPALRLAAFLRLVCHRWIPRKVMRASVDSRWSDADRSGFLAITGRVIRDAGRPVHRAKVWV